MRLLLLIVSVVLVACVGATDPSTDRRHCLYPGDTIAYQVVTVGGIAILCDWTVKTTPVTCTVADAQRYGTADCVEGEKWPRG